MKKIAREKGARETTFASDDFSGEEGRNLRKNGRLWQLFVNAGNYTGGRDAYRGTRFLTGHQEDWPSTDWNHQMKVPVECRGTRSLSRDELRWENGITEGGEELIQSFPYKVDCLLNFIMGGSEV